MLIDAPPEGIDSRTMEEWRVPRFYEREFAHFKNHKSRIHTNSRIHEQLFLIFTNHERNRFHEFTNEFANEKEPIPTFSNAYGYGGGGLLVPFLKRLGSSRGTGLPTHYHMCRAVTTGLSVSFMLVKLMIVLVTSQVHLSKISRLNDKLDDAKCNG